MLYHTFENELGNFVKMGITEYRGLVNIDKKQYDAIRITASGPVSQVDHTWTRVEAEKLHEILGDLLGK